MRRVATILLVTAAACATASSRATRAAEPPAFDAVAQPFFAKHCLRCHDAKRQEGEFRLDVLPRDFGTQAVAERWSEVLFRITAGEMPPKKEPQPTVEELARAAEWISARLKEGEAARISRRGPVSHYRLSREEYGHTVRDLLGVHFDVTAPGAFDEDPRRHGFDRIGALLSLSPSHVERYLRAAETVVDRAFPVRAAKSETVRTAADDGKWKEQGHSGPVRWLLWPGQGRQAFVVRTPGRYVVRVRLSALPSLKGRTPALVLWHNGAKKLVAGRDVLAAEDAPVVVEFDELLAEGAYSVRNEAPGQFSDQFTLGASQFVFRSTAATRQERPTGYRLFESDGRPTWATLMIDGIEAEGPLESDADRAQRAGFVPEKEGDLDAARASLARFAARAWRRPVSDAEIERYVGLVRSETEAGEKFPAAYRTALVALLASKNFWYLAEGEPGRTRATVDDVELASRLSYFLWSSLPDEELSAAARSGSLSRPEVLRSQVARLLDDPRSARFAESFPRQWLQLHRVGQFPPDPELYPDWDKWLERSLVLESTLYFDAMFRRNLPLREFLDSDWTILNPRLALHYGLPRLPEPRFQRVALRPEDRRGGLLTQASVLSLTSDGTRHRPVHRGVWVSEAVFARTPPPPPPNVEPLEPTPSDKPKATIRQQLEAHATHAVCASCHRRIDPLGFAFDNYDAIGRWRTREQVPGGRGEDPPVDAHGTLSDGRSFAGPEEFKKVLAADEDRFAEAFVEQLATYALRRAMTIDDAEGIKAVAAAGRRDGYRLRSLVEHLATSDLFRKR